MGNNGNPCAHQAAVALKYGIAGINFIPQRPEERFSLAKLATGNHKELQSEKFVHLHQKNTAEMEMDSGDQCVPLHVNSLCETPDEPQDSIQSPEKGSKIDDEFELENILHRQVSNNIELKLRTTDKNFWACYEKYLEIYRNHFQIFKNLPNRFQNQEDKHHLQPLQQLL